MFHAAFTEVGVRGGRPEATDWVKALDDLGRHIHRCGTIHRFSRHLARCPWCSAERQGVVFFPQPVVASPPVAYDLQRAWANIEAVVAPVIPSAPSISKAGLAPRPLPASGSQGGRRGLINSLMAGIREGTEKANERARRQWALNNARSALERIVADLPVTCGVQAFHAKKSELTRRRAEYLTLKADATKEVQKLLDAAAEDQKRRFLESFPVSAARVQGVGATKKQAMQSAGIRTAADVSMASLLQLKGFGTTSAVAMTRWRAACEQRFQFDPQLSHAEVAAVQVRYAKRRQTLEKALDDGAAVLGSLVVSARINTQAMMGKLAQALTEVAQAEVDLTIC
jgi:DNA-binding helix-hairpin-helix protein with protein kinase domain